MHLIWAYGDKDITNETDFVKHSNKGFSSQKVVMVPDLPTPTKGAAPSLQSSICGTVYLTVAFGEVLMMLI